MDSKRSLNGDNDFENVHLYLHISISLKTLIKFDKLTN